MKGRPTLFYTLHWLSLPTYRGKVLRPSTRCFYWFKQAAKCCSGRNCVGYTGKSQKRGQQNTQVGQWVFPRTLGTANRGFPDTVSIKSNIYLNLSVTLKFEAVRCSETSVHFNNTLRIELKHDHNLKIDHCEKLKTYRGHTAHFSFQVYANAHRQILPESSPCDATNLGFVFMLQIISLNSRMTEGYFITDKL
jgi:hypothetical protein